MFVDLGRWLAGSLVICLYSLTTVVDAQESVGQLIGDVADYWTPEWAADALPMPLMTQGSEVTPTQMLAPQRSPSNLLAQNRRRSSATDSSTSDLSSVPFMIGDTGAGTCLTIAGSSTFAIEHPTLTCSRLNVSENNTPIPTDRTFVSYRHFKNVTGVRVLTDFERDYNVDRFTLGTERTFLDGIGSLEIRLPLERRLTSNFGSFVSNGAGVFDPFIGDRQNELGNVAVMLKALLAERGDWTFSGGLGVTIPTARDFTYSYFFDRAFLVDFFPGAPAPDSFRFDVEGFDIEITNDTLYLSPFLSWLWQPDGRNGRFFHQGFMQVEVAANASRATAFGAATSTFTDFGFFPFQDVTLSLPVEGRSTDIFSQTLLRLNLGWGYVLAENPQASCLKRLTSLFELHYTTTLQRPNRTSIAIDLTAVPPIPITPDLLAFLNSAFTFGNEREHTNIVNVVAGLSANVASDGRTVVTTGLILPVSQGDERAFDLEYNLQVQRLF